MLEYLLFCFGFRLFETRAVACNESTFARWTYALVCVNWKVLMTTHPRRALHALLLLATTVVLGCAPTEEEATDEIEEELRLFPDPACPGPIAMSRRSYAALPVGYEGRSAAEKQAALWSVLEGTAYARSCRPSSGLFLSGLAALNTAPNIETTVVRASDELPIGRRKMVHPFGAVASFDLVVDPASTYTGVLAPSAVVHGVLRASLGGDPNVIGFTPGVAFKFLLDGKPSLNVVAMHSLMGQKSDTNFFRHPFSNEVPEPHTNVARSSWLDWAKADAFALAQNIVFAPALARGPETPTPNNIRVDHLAMRTADGALVPDAERKHPSHLVFRAPQHLISWWDRPEHRRFDYRDMLGALGAGTVLYEVYGKANAAAPEVRIGVVRTTSAFVASTWGDYRLFFRHNDHQNNEDVAR